jgi:hypothetical protein
MRCARVFWGLLVAFWLGAPAISAAQAAAATRTAPVPPREYAGDLLLAGHLALYTSDVMDEGGLFGGTALLRYSVLAAGASLDLGGAPFENGVVNASLLGGLSWQTELGVRLELLGALGVDRFHAEDGGLLSNDPGTSATLGCAGGRAGVWYRFPPRGTGHFIVGVYSSYLQSFERVTRHYSYFDDSWFSDELTLVEAEQDFGGRRISFAATMGLAFDLMPR